MGSNPFPGAGARSIHYRRRWAYVLWVSLLLLSLGTWIRWEQPAIQTSASLVVRLAIHQAPPNTRVRVWAGPWSHWNGPDGLGSAVIQVSLGADGGATLPVFRIPVARRRWVQHDYIPRGTWDLMLMQFDAPGEPPRYLALPLSMDIRTGALRPHWRLTTSIGIAWTSLATTPQVPAEKP